MYDKLLIYSHIFKWEAIYYLFQKVSEHQEVCFDAGAVEGSCFHQKQFVTPKHTERQNKHE